MFPTDEEVDRVVRALLGTPAAGRGVRRVHVPPEPGSFAARLKEARRLRGWKQTKMARELGFTESYYQSVESGRRPATVSFRAAAYAWALGVGLERLFDPGHDSTAATAGAESATAATVREKGEGRLAAAPPEGFTHLRRRSSDLMVRCFAQSVRLAELFRRSEAACARSQAAFGRSEALAETSRLINGRRAR